MLDYTNAVHRGFVGDLDEYQELLANQTVEEESGLVPLSPPHVYTLNPEWSELILTVGSVLAIVFVEYLITVWRNQPVSY